MTAGPTARAGAAEPATGWRDDLVAGLLAAALGTAVLLHVRGFPELPDGAPGPALFPGIVGGLLVLFGLALAVRSVLTRRRGRPAGGPPAAGEAGAEVAGAAAEGPAGTMKGRLDALAVLGLVVAYLLLVDVLGFVVTMSVLLFLLMWRLGARPLVAAGSAVLTTGLVVVLFQQVLFVPLPIGPLGF